MKTFTAKQSDTIEIDLHKKLEYLGLFLKELRLNFGYTQMEAAQKIGINRNTLQNAEYGRNITLHTLLLMSEYFDIDIFNDFFADIR